MAQEFFPIMRALYSGNYYAQNYADMHNRQIPTCDTIPTKL